MSNLEIRPVETECEHAPAPSRSGRPVVEVLTAREVPLGGPRAMTVHRTLPQRQRSLIGAWCFADHYGPDDVSTSGGMDVPPHPHTGLQTVSWLFAGEIEHRDSGGNHALVRPGEMNLMTGGRGVCHSEVSTPGTQTLHGVQLWVALPDAARDEPRSFQHHVPPSLRVTGATVRVLLGTLLGQTSRCTRTRGCWARRSCWSRRPGSPWPWTPPSSTASWPTARGSRWRVSVWAAPSSASSAPAWPG